MKSTVSHKAAQARYYARHKEKIGQSPALRRAKKKYYEAHKEEINKKQAKLNLVRYHKMMELVKKARAAGLDK